MEILQKPIKLKRVVAYCRISMITDRTELSYQTQIEYYKKRIQENPNWIFAGIYSDHGISATSTNKREGLKAMLEAARSGQFDIILTKSISRLARNTVDLLEITREMKSLGVEIIFEKEHLSNLTSDGELMLTLLASFAQAESEQRSKDVRWAIKKRFEKGLAYGFRTYGYTSSRDASDVKIILEEAEIVRWVYDQYLKKVSCEKMADQLTKRGVRLRYQPTEKVDPESLRAMLKNKTYTGDLLLQKSFSPKLGQHSQLNRGELPFYEVKGAIPQIISYELFEKVQAEIARRRALGAKANWSLNPIALTGMMTCKSCGKNFVRCSRNPKTKNNIQTHCWKCGNIKDNKPCPTTTRSFTHVSIKELIADVLNIDSFDESVFLDKIKRIYVGNDHTFTFLFYDGHEETRQSKPNNRRHYWSDEMKKAWGEALKKKSKRAKDLGLNARTLKFLPEELAEFRKVASRNAATKRKELNQW